MKRAICVIALCAGCGDDADEPRLEGLWYFSSNTKQCDYAVVFEGDQYETDIVCTLESGAIGVEAEAGSFTHTDRQIVITPKLSSCHDARDYPSTLAYEFLGERLRITTPTGVVVLERIEPTEATPGQFTYGCYDETGIFTPMTVEPI